MLIFYLKIRQKKERKRKNKFLVTEIYWEFERTINLNMYKLRPFLGKFFFFKLP